MSDLHGGEPVFVIRAQDRLAVDAISAWIGLARAAGIFGNKLQRATDVRAEVARWQRMSRDKVKDPD